MAFASFQALPSSVPPLSFLLYCLQQLSLLLKALLNCPTRRAQPQNRIKHHTRRDFSFFAKLSRSWMSFDRKGQRLWLLICFDITQLKNIFRGKRLWASQAFLRDTSGGVVKGWESHERIYNKPRSSRFLITVLQPLPPPKDPRYPLVWSSPTPFPHFGRTRHEY